MTMDFTNVYYASRRLLTFLVSLFVRLNLGENTFSWNVVRLYVRDGFYVHVDWGDSVVRGGYFEPPGGVQPPVVVGSVVCFACHRVAFGSVNEFVHAVFNAYYNTRMSAEDREIGYVSVESGFFHLQHEPTCYRSSLNVDDLTNFVDLLSIRKLVHIGCLNNVANAITAVTQNDSGGGFYKCKICLTKQTDVACIPCGHVYACFDCQMNHLRVAQQSAPVACFVCRTPVRSIVQLYFT